MYEWLDKIIAEQAAHYGLTVEQHAQLQRDAATVQERLEQPYVYEPDSDTW